MKGKIVSLDIEFIEFTNGACTFKSATNGKNTTFELGYDMDRVPHLLNTDSGELVELNKKDERTLTNFALIMYNMLKELG